MQLAQQLQEAHLMQLQQLHQMQMEQMMKAQQEQPQYTALRSKKPKPSADDVEGLPEAELMRNPRDKRPFGEGLDA